MTEEELNVQVQAAQDEIARLRETFGPAYAKLGEALYSVARETELATRFANEFAEVDAINAAIDEQNAAIETARAEYETEQARIAEEEAARAAEEAARPGRGHRCCCENRCCRRAIGACRRARSRARARSRKGAHLPQVRHDSSAHRQVLRRLWKQGGRSLCHRSPTLP